MERGVGADFTEHGLMRTSREGQHGFAVSVQALSFGPKSETELHSQLYQENKNKETPDTSFNPTF